MVLRGWFWPLFAYGNLFCKCCHTVHRCRLRDEDLTRNYFEFRSSGNSVVGFCTLVATSIQYCKIGFITVHSLVCMSSLINCIESEMNGINLPASKNCRRQKKACLNLKIEELSFEFKMTKYIPYKHQNSYNTVDWY